MADGWHRPDEGQAAPGERRFVRLGGGASPYDRLILRALAELEAAARAAEQGRLVRTYSVQLLLALLFDRSDGDQSPFEAFLRHACDDHSLAWARHVRAAAVRQAFEGIRQSVERGCRAGSSFPLPDRAPAAPHGTRAPSRMTALA